MRSRIRTRLLAAFLAIAVLSAAGLSYYFLTELEGFALRKLEERLDTQARLVAAFRSATFAEKGLAAAQGRALVADSLRSVGADVPSRMRVLDRRGIVVADSAPPTAAPEPSRLGDRPEVRAALSGKRGATTRISDEGRVVLYVAYPIAGQNGEVIGVSYAAASTFSIRTLVKDYRTRLAWVVVAFVVATFLVTELLARWLANPLLELESGVTRFARGEHSVRVTPRGSREVRAVAESFNTLADEVEGALTELRTEERRKSRFVSDVSHELRTPLTAIRGAAETLMEDDVDAEDRHRFLKTIVSESDRLTRLANDLIILQRIEGATGELPLRRIDLGAVVRRAVEALEPLMEERGVTVTLDGEAPEVLGDVDRIQQVVGNLVDNASRVSPSGGAIRVSMGRDGRWATIAVTDSGPGIPAEDLGHVFERFYRSQPSRARSSGGVGLGLSIVKAIVTAHGGDVAAANAEGAGAVFTLRLPALEPLPPEVTEA
ncbi:MAG TPA: ATP-binding protein [Coriobacteriia bacterium]|jgi:two-component system OmpR family sensor kinase